MLVVEANLLFGQFVVAYQRGFGHGCSGTPERNHTTVPCLRHTVESRLEDYEDWTWGVSGWTARRRSSRVAQGGLGRPMVATYAAAGANVVVASRNRDNIERVARGITEKGLNALAVAVDITDADSVDALIAKTVDAFGSLDVNGQQRGPLGTRPRAGRYPARRVARCRGTESDRDVHPVLGLPAGR